MKRKKLLIGIGLVFTFTLCGVKSNAETVEHMYEASDFCSKSADLHYENELKIDELYDYVDYVPIYNDGRNPVNEGKYVNVKWTKYSWISYKHITWCDYEVLPKYVYSIYQVGVVDAPYWSDTPKLYYADFTPEINFNTTRTKTDTYENSLKKTLSNEFGGKINFGGDFQLGDTFTHTYEEKFSSKHEIVEASGRSEKVKLWGDGFYCSQRRATYKLYIVLAFEAEYEVTERVQRVMLYNDRIYTFKKKGYRYKGKSLQFEYSGNCYDALSRYLFDDDGNFYYVPKKDSITYKDNFIYL